MSYEKLSRPPHESAYVPILQNRNLDSNLIVIPSAHILKEEVAAWHDLRGGLGDNHNALYLAEKLSSDIGSLVVRRQMIAAVATRSALLAGSADHRAVTNWQAESAMLIGFSELTRDLGVLSVLKDFAKSGVGRSTSPRKFLVDVSDAEKSKTGLHVDGETAESMGFEDFEVGKEQWFEGEHIFVRGARPAEFTTDIRNQYREQWGIRLDRMGVMSLVARIKMDRWLEVEA